jgi:hypothetical protein
LELSYSTGNEIVDAVSEMNFTGNIVPLTWFKTMTGESGKPKLLAIDLLADIVYWYRATEIRDEQTGELLGFQKKFQADLLQRSYRQIEQRFGVTKKQARAALDYLCAIGVIRKHLRNEKTARGMPIHNNMYIELVPERLKVLTYPQSDNDVPFREPRCALEGTRVVTYRAEGCALEGTTSTENTTEIIKGDYDNRIYPRSDGMEDVLIYEEIIKENINYAALIQEKGGLYKNSVDEIVGLIVDTVAVPRQNILIGGTKYPYELVKSQMLKLNYEHISYVMACMRENTAKVKNIRGYTLTALYNAVHTIDHYYQAEVNHDWNGGK